MAELILTDDERAAKLCSELDDAAYRPGPLRKRLDEAIEKVRA